MKKTDLGMLPRNVGGGRRAVRGANALADVANSGPPPVHSARSPVRPARPLSSAADRRERAAQGRFRHAGRTSRLSAGLFEERARGAA